MTASARLRGLAATLALAALLGGLPWVLIQLGPPTPRYGWGWASLLTELTTPDDGHLAVELFKVAGWITWAVLAYLILVEIVARLRHLEAPSLRGLGLGQGMVRGLVASAALLFIATGHAGPLLAAHATPPAPITRTETAPRVPVGRPATAASPARTYTVQPGDSLWRIAEAHLGDGARFGELVDLNHDLLGGRPGFLRPGWTLKLPATSATVTVQPGDTLSGIARAHFDGDESAYRQIFDASRHLPQPDGHQLTDPDLILPGWHLNLTAPAAQPTVETDAHPAPALAPVQAPASSVPRSAAEQSSALPTTGTPQPEPAAALPAPVAAETPAVPVQTPQATDSAAPAAWQLAGLLGAGVLLAGSLQRLLARRRAWQQRARRPGRRVADPPADLERVEKTLMAAGSGARATVETLDRLLWQLTATLAAAEEPMPALTAVALSRSGVDLQLAEPGSPPAPWRRSDSEGRRWHLESAALPAALGDSERGSEEPPYPQLVTVGADDEGTQWLIDAEQLGALTVTGDPTFADDFVRYLVAEFAMNPWGRDLRVELVGLEAELVGLNVERVSHYVENERVGYDLADAARNAEWLADNEEPNVTSARAHAAGDAVWASTVLITCHGDDPRVESLQRLIADQPRQTATSVVLFGRSELASTAADRESAPAATEIRLTDEGRVLIPALGLDLVAVGLTADEAAGCAASLDASDDFDSVPIPAMPTGSEQSWRQHCDQAGQLRGELALPRTDDEPQAESVLPADDQVYLAAGSTTEEDLAVLAPRVTDEVRTRVAHADPTLDADLARWRDPGCSVPRLTVLGPVTLRLPVGRPDSPEAIRRRALCLDLLAFLALHPEGVSRDQIADALDVTQDRVRRYMSVVRQWLGVDPDTGRQHVPEATQSPAALTRGVHLYQLDGVLVDADLFRRLRVRGVAAGPGGIADLRAALDLVKGRPLDQLRDKGGLWLATDRFDHILAAAIVDVAHVLALDALQRREYAEARGIAELATRAAPYDEVATLDLVAAVNAEGRTGEADRILLSRVFQPVNDDDAPGEVNPRTADVTHRHGWTGRRRAAS